ncbi:MAG TPA: aldo/keto reductase [Bacteroidales bacterium]|nr:aldo/keto reductase [Bacteroidales bacterium]HBZ20190.1 aldo/keto reductase [Bacteroidales bacterium]
MGKKNFTRREFVATVAAGAGTVFIGKTVNAIPPDRKASMFDPLEIVTLGKTGIKTTLLGMGTGYSGYNRSSNITRAGVAESVIRAAWERGIRYFDCADSYGTHPFTQAALKGIPREKYVLGTKMWVTAGGIPEKERPDSAVVVDRFRKELNTDYIDLVQLHCMTTGGWSDEQKRFMDGLETLKAKNIIRAHGLSVHSFDALKVASGHPWVDVIHVRINPFGEAMDQRDPSLVVPVIEKFHKSGKGVIGMKLIGGGKLKDDPQKIDESLKFVLGLKTVDMIIIGFEKPEQIDNYIERIRKVQKM